MELVFLSDKGDVYRVCETQALACELSIEPVKIPACNQQSNDDAERFVSSFKRDYVNLTDRSSSEIVFAQLSGVSTRSMKCTCTDR